MLTDGAVCGCLLLFVYVCCCFGAVCCGFVAVRLTLCVVICCVVAVVLLCVDVRWLSFVAV